MTGRAFTKGLALLIGLLLVASACGDSDVTSDDGIAIGSSSNSSESDNTPAVSTAAPTTAAPTTAAPSSGGSGGGGTFCRIAGELDDDDPFQQTNLSAEFFEDLDDDFGKVIGAAPSEIRGDMEIIRDGMRTFAGILADFDYNVLDPGLASAMDAFDTDDMDAAGDRIDAFLEKECGISPDDDDDNDFGAGSGTITDPATASSLAETFENLDEDEAFVVALMAFLGVDEELAKCLNEELGGFDTDDPDPELLTKEVCGTTMLELMTGFGG